MGVAVIVVLVVAPLIATLAAVVGQEWHPASDIAVEVLRIDDVGGSHTPLAGPHSRYRWDHPGPLLFWLLAPFSWLFGTAGVLGGVATLNALATVGAVLIARRRGGLPLTALVGVVVLMLCYAQGADLLVNPWNPWVAVLPFFTYLLLAWSLAERDFPVLPWLVAVGTFLVQAHLGYAPLVLGAGLVGALVAWRWPTVTDPDPGSRPAGRGAAARGLRRPGLVALAVGALLWSPPVIQQLTADRGNFGALMQFLRDPSEPVVGWSAGWGIMGTELGFPGAWLTGDELGLLGVRTSSSVPALTLLVLAAALGALASRRGATSAGRLALLVVVTSGLGLVASSRVTGLVGSYLVRWWWVIAATLWLSVGWSLWSLLGGHRARRALLMLSVAASAGLAGVMVWQATSADVPDPQHSMAIGRLGDEIARQLDPDGAYGVEWTDGRDWGAVGIGVYLDLERRGFSVSVMPRHAPVFGNWRAAALDQVDGTVLVVGADDVDRGFSPPTGAEVIARYEPLTPGERPRADQLEEEIRQSIGAAVGWAPSMVDTPFGRAVLADQGARTWAIEQLATLRASGSGYTAYLLP